METPRSTSATPERFLLLLLSCQECLNGDSFRGLLPKKLTHVRNPRKYVTRLRLPSKQWNSTLREKRVPKLWRGWSTIGHKCLRQDAKSWPGRPISDVWVRMSWPGQPNNGALLVGGHFAILIRELFWWLFFLKRAPFFKTVSKGNCYGSIFFLSVLLVDRPTSEKRLIKEV